MKESVHQAGFAPPIGRPLGKEWRTVMVAELVTTAALAFCTFVVAIVVSIGAARAEPADIIVGHESRLFAVSLLLGVIFIGISGLGTILPRRKHKR